MTQRTEARLAGYAYLAYIVFAMSAAVLSSKSTAGTDTSQMLANLRRMMSIARVTVLLDLLQIVCAIVLAVTLYRLSKTVDATLALIAMAFRFGEGLLRLCAAPGQTGAHEAGGGIEPLLHRQPWVPRHSGSDL